MTSPDSSRKPRVELLGVRHRADCSIERELGSNEVAYEVFDQPAQQKRDMRTASRNRTRLRSAKILNLLGEFICHSRIHDRSRTGLRLALEPRRRLPDTLLILDDETEVISIARIVWRQDATLGVRILPGVMPGLTRADLNALRTKYYGVPNR